jgi:hypothetical protein
MNTPILLPEAPLWKSEIPQFSMPTKRLITGIVLELILVSGAATATYFYFAGGAPFEINAEILTASWAGAGAVALISVVGMTVTVVKTVHKARYRVIDGVVEIPDQHLAPFIDDRLTQVNVDTLTAKRNIQELSVRLIELTECLKEIEKTKNDRKPKILEAKENGKFGIGILYNKKHVPAALVQLSKQIDEATKQIKTLANRIEWDYIDQIADNLREKQGIEEAQKLILDWDLKVHYSLEKIWRAKIMLPPTNEDPETNSIPLISDAIHDLSWKIRSLSVFIDFENRLKRKIPFTALKHLMFMRNIKQLNRRRAEEIDRFIKKLNEEKNLSQDHLHEFFLTLLDYIKAAIRVPNRGVAILEYWLRSLGLKLFDQPDPEHMEWREPLRPGLVIDYVTANEEKRTITLGDYYYPQKRGDRLIFLLPDYPGKVFVSGINRYQLEIERVHDAATRNVLEPKHFYPHLANVFYTDVLGRFSIVEQLERPIQKDDLKTNPKVMEALCRLLALFIEKHAMLENFSFDDLMVSSAGELRFATAKTAQKLDFHCLEEILIRFTERDPDLLKEIYSRSGITESTYVLAYRNVVKEALKAWVNGKEKPENSPAEVFGRLSDHMSSIVGPSIDQGEVLMREVRVVANRLWGERTEKQKSSSVKRSDKEQQKTNQSIRKQIMNEIIAAHKEGGYGGVLPANFMNPIEEK